MASPKDPADQHNPWVILASLALAVSFIFLVPVSHVRTSGARESKTTWQLLTAQEVAARR